MTLHQFLALFPHVKETKKGWDVNCPAHDDRHPSLGVMEGDGGRIVLNCFAGCTTSDICQSLGLGLQDLFQATPLRGLAAPITPFIPATKRIDKRKLAFSYELHSLDLRRQAEKILAASTNCQDCDTWTNDERDLAMKAVGRAYQYLERAQFCESYADHVREQDYELKRLALG